MFRNFFVIHRSGKTYFAKNFRPGPDRVHLRPPIAASLVVGFSSSISSFCKTLLGEEVREVTSLNGRIVYKEVGDFIFVAHSDLRVGSSIIQSILADVVSVCEMLFGAFQHWDQDTFDLSGAQDIINMYFARATHDPSIAVSGLTQIFLDGDITERLDKLLAFLESQEGVCGNGTMLVLGESVLHSRMPLADTRMILQFHKARSLGVSSVRFTPIFTSGAWHNLYAVRINSFVLFAMLYIDKPYSMIEKKIEEFQTTLIQSRLEIPIEASTSFLQTAWKEPPVLLRLYAKRETLAMLYSNIKTGATVFPALRPGPEVQQREILDAFWCFFSDASTALRTPGVTEFAMCRDAYRFYAKSEGIHKLYVLLSSDTQLADIPTIAADILKNIRSAQ
ncbi:hypothetical protein HK105_202958 [Polyrhizophydium stewartii]|uniref:Uncharacterized protein n=1 Tax=Polyrhizophydium stewartii TaxID=2732419 RepID=A0ABR4NCS2_9FUNG